MKYGVNTHVWTFHVTEADEPLFSRIREWGFDGVEIFLGSGEPENIASVRQMLDRLGLERTTSAVVPREANLISSDREVRARGVAFLKRCVERTAELAAQQMAGPLYAGLGVMAGRRRSKDEWQWAVDGLRTAAQRGQELGVLLCLEPLNRFETYFLNTLEDAARLARDTEMPNVRVHFDTFHANIEEKQPAHSIRAVAEELGHVHLSENDRGVPGTGHIDWRAIMLALKEVGYDGWVTIESFAHSETGLASAAIWRDIAPSGDEVARRGLAFIKGLCRDLGL
jgi:D-psicose/D-tagatose/L-ribulose 3-epimerase